MKGEFWEWVVIFLGIISLWPRYVLQWENPLWQVFAYLMLILLVGVFVRRVRRFREAARAHENGKKPKL